MKPWTSALLALLIGGAASGADPVERFEQAYGEEGDALIVALAWLPETAEVARPILPEFESWDGGGEGRWLGVPEETRRELFEALARRWRGRDSAAGEVMARARLWRDLASRLAEVYGAVEGPEDFLGSVHAVEPLRPAFDAVLANRPEDFDPSFLGSTLSSAEFAAFPPGLVLLLMGLPERRRTEALRRLFVEVGLPDPGRAWGRGGKEPVWESGKK